MNNHRLILIDTGIIVAFYDRKDKYHQQALNFFSTCTSELITTIACVTEVMWLLAPNIKVQNEFLSALLKQAILCEHLLPSDYQRIQELQPIKTYLRTLPIYHSSLFLKG
jgi:predicted nucleic acid-binding protein